MDTWMLMVFKNVRILWTINGFEQFWHFGLWYANNVLPWISVIPKLPVTILLISTLALCQWQTIFSFVEFFLIKILQNIGNISYLQLQILLAQAAHTLTDRTTDTSAWVTTPSSAHHSQVQYFVSMDFCFVHFNEISRRKKWRSEDLKISIN